MRVLAIHPWIYDFAAFDFWLKPYGFLQLLSFLKRRGIEVDFIDCLDAKVSRDRFGRGKYRSVPVSPPRALAGIPVPRQYKRYGISPATFESLLEGKHPDGICITLCMTYWHPVLADLVPLLRKRFPGIPIWLGGCYATLCPEHAAGYEFDGIFSHQDLPRFLQTLGIRPDPDDFEANLPDYPAFYSNPEYAVFRFSRGCPLRCGTCAVSRFSPEFRTIPPAAVLDFLVYHHERGIRDFVFYDDALLYRRKPVVALLESIARLDRDFRFHTPNALHFKYLDGDIASLMKKTGFVDPRFGLETLDPVLRKTWKNKVSRLDLERGTALLRKAGFDEGTFSVYLVLGYPGQDPKFCERDAAAAHAMGARVSLAEYSPVPGTPLFESAGDRALDPVLCNNSIYGLRTRRDFERRWRLKNRVKAAERHRFSNRTP
jgi:hypothetical protein